MKTKKVNIKRNSIHLSNIYILVEISAPALLRMRLLLGDYLKLLVPQMKSSETEENEKIKSYSQQNNTNGSLTFLKTI
jgi:hypothetical protein